jgi:hypothetical protein
MYPSKLAIPIVLQYGHPVHCDFNFPIFCSKTGLQAGHGVVNGLEMLFDYIVFLKG